MREAERVGKALPAEELDLVVFTTGIFAALRPLSPMARTSRDFSQSRRRWSHG